MKDIIWIVKSLEGSSLFWKGVSEIIKMKLRNKTGIPNMLLGILGASLLGKYINS